MVSTINSDLDLNDVHWTFSAATRFLHTDYPLVFNKEPTINKIDPSLRDRFFFINLSYNNKLQNKVLCMQAEHVTLFHQDLDNWGWGWQLDIIVWGELQFPYLNRLA